MSPPIIGHPASIPATAPAVPSAATSGAEIDRLRQVARSAFPALDRPEAILDNAGGSQVPACVMDAVREHMLRHYVQLGAGYPISTAATETVQRAHDLANALVNGTGIGRVVLGPSTTALLETLAAAHRRVLRSGDEIIVAECNHESNVRAWIALEELGITIRWWKSGDEPTGCPLDALDGLLNSRTRLVCFPHVSNLLGGVVDVAEVTRRCHSAGAKVVVDGVAFAAHRPVDVRAWGCDFYVYSTYKVYGPHMAALFGRDDAFAPLPAPNHFFLPRDTSYAFELGGASHEGCAGIVALWDYLGTLASAARPDVDLTDPRAVAVAAFETMSALEMPLQRTLLSGLSKIPGVTLLGTPGFGPERVPTVSLLHDRVEPRAIVAAAHARGLWFRHGHMYSYRLCQARHIPTDQGVVRISAVHYNTVEEMERTVAGVADALRA